MDAIVSEFGIWIADLTIRNALGIKYTTFLNKLTCRTKQKSGYDKIAKVYKYEYLNNVKYLCVPRGCFKTPTVAQLFKPMFNFNPEHLVNLKTSTLELRDDQVIIVKHILNEFANPNPLYTLDAPGGVGKTFIAAALIKELSKRCLYIVANENLQEQTSEDLSGCFPEASIVLTNGTTNIDTAITADITVMIINTAINLLKNKHTFISNYDFIILDEIHVYCSPERREIFWNLPKYCLGLSGTTNDRTDGFDFIYHKHLGPVIKVADIPGFKLSNENEFRGEVKVIDYYRSRHGQPPCSIEHYSEVIKTIITDDSRNALIINECGILLKDPARNIIIFTESRDHVVKLLDEIKKATNTKVSAPEITMLRGGISDEEKINMNTARVLIATYGCSSFGLSIPRYNSAIFATPRYSGFKQICWRVMRRGSDVNIVRKFVDVVDRELCGRGQFYARRNVYKMLNFELKSST